MAGGIVGSQSTANAIINNAYNKGIIITTDNTEANVGLGGVVAKKDAGNINNTYFYAEESSELLGIGVGGTSEDVTNKTQSIFNSLEEFIAWCKENNNYVNTEE